MTGNKFQCNTINILQIYLQKYNKCHNNYCKSWITILFIIINKSIYLNDNYSSLLLLYKYVHIVHHDLVSKMAFIVFSFRLRLRMRLHFEHFVFVEIVVDRIECLRYRNNDRRITIYGGASKEISTFR